MLAVAGISPKSALSEAEMQAGAQRLGDTGLFADVSFTFNAREVHYDLKPSPQMLPAQYANFPWWSQKELEAQVESRVPLFHGSLPLDSATQTNVIHALVAILAERQIAASVSAVAHSELGSAKGQTVAFHLDKPVVELGAIKFSGASPAWTKPLDTVVARADSDEFRDQSTAAGLRADVEHVYHNKGFLDARVTDVALQPPVVSDDKVLVPVTISLTEGEQYHMGQFALTGSTLMTQDEFAKAAPLKTGDPAAEDKLKASLKLLRDAYGAHGYIHAAANPSPTLDSEKHVVDYTIAVIPGNVYTMGTFDVTGLDNDLRAQLLSSWKLKAGDIFDSSYPVTFINASREASRQLRAYDVTYRQMEHSDARATDVVISFSRTK